MCERILMRWANFAQTNAKILGKCRSSTLDVKKNSENTEQRSLKVLKVAHCTIFGHIWVNSKGIIHPGFHHVPLDDSASEHNAIGNYVSNVYLWNSLEIRSLRLSNSLT
jgi:hypothetical protein